MIVTQSAASQLLQACGFNDSALSEVKDDVWNIYVNSMQAVVKITEIQSKIAELLHLFGQSDPRLCNVDYINIYLGSDKKISLPLAGRRCNMASFEVSDRTSPLGLLRFLAIAPQPEREILAYMLELSEQRGNPVLLVDMATGATRFATKDIPDPYDTRPSAWRVTFEASVLPFWDAQKLEDFKKSIQQTCKVAQSVELLGVSPLQLTWEAKASTVDGLPTARECRITGLIRVCQYHGSYHRLVEILGSEILPT